MRINTFFYSIRQGLKNIFRNKMFSLASVATMAACIFMFGLFYIIVTNFSATVHSIEEGVSVTVFFEHDATDAQIRDIGEKINKRAEVSKNEYVSADGKKCHCFKQAIINTVYAQSNIRQILRIENFDNFRYDFYSKEEKNPLTGLSSYETAQKAVRECHYFIDDFDHKPKNLLFYGKTGVGKTFLTNCVAKELLDHGYSVIYFTAFQLFDILSKGVFEKDSDAIATHQNIFDCDLLVIDDLGTELINSFTSSQLFLCVNERLIRQKSTIISTNLSVERIKESYSERTFSRILDSYTFINLFTEEDIRKQKRTRIISR